MSSADTVTMKTTCIIIFTVFLALAVAEDTALKIHTGTGIKGEFLKKNAGVAKSTKAYSKAKEECLKRSEELKGKKLTDCIVEYQKEAK